MSKPIDPISDDVLGLERPLDALQTSPDFRGPVEPLDGDFCNDHFALIYESSDDQFAAVAPFIRQGVERGEHCLYVVDENDVDDVKAALRDRGVGVDAALESGALAFETIQNTYLRDNQFDADEMISVYEEIIRETTEKYEAFRLAADMSWILEAEVSVEECMTYESKVNELFDEEDAVAVCQYDREAFPQEVLCDVVRVHPHLIYDTTVCHNFYYIPPLEFCDTTQSTHELDRMLGTLLDRTRAKVELRERERYLQRQNDITADPEKSFEEKLQSLFELGCERFGLEVGAMARVDIEENRFEVEYVSEDHEHFKPGVELPFSETYCAAATEIRAAGSVSDPEAECSDGIFVHDEFTIRSFLSTYIDVDSGTDRAFFFVSSEERTDGFSDDEHAFLRSMGQWVTYELEGNQRERELERTVDRLETSNERLEQFAYAASHDLQEPLRMVSSYLQLIDARDADLSDENQEFLEFAVDGADRMRDMIDGLLEYSRIETRGAPLEPIELDAVLEDVREDLRFQFINSGAELTVESLPRVKGDSNQLRQLFQNLFANAIKYSGDEPPQIEVTADRAGTKWTISVRDEGIGIGPDEQDRIFDIFNRLHSRDTYDGAGIGLALCERIAERHGGKIWADSELGEGSTFSVTLPATNLTEH